MQTINEPAPLVSETAKTREELRALVLAALQASAEGTALVPPTRGTHKLPDGTIITRR